jgi:hypothetical protein
MSVDVRRGDFISADRKRSSRRFAAAAFENADHHLHVGPAPGAVRPEPASLPRFAYQIPTAGRAPTADPGLIGVLSSNVFP